MDEGDEELMMLGEGDLDASATATATKASSPSLVESGEFGDSQTPKHDVKKLEAPYVGMLFETVEEARIYYEDYGRQEGFWTRTRSSAKTRSRSNEVTGKQFVSAHEGKIVSKADKEDNMEEKDKKQADEKEKKKKIGRSCSTVKCGCTAHLRIRHDKWTDKWKVSVFNDDHNHKVVTPIRRIKMRSNRNMPKAAKDLTEAFQRENLQIGKIPSILGGAQIGFDDRDCYNHLKNVRHRELEGGDAQSVLTYFRKKQAENPQFYYAMQCDEDGRAANFFWVDARSRMSYQYFGDVVTFDTTYRTNKYDMPFAPFTGVNHHFQSVQFGCALLQDETEVTFLWLFETWLAAMGGRHPISIITDEDLAMRGAIAKVFPNTRHRLCYWHIKKKFAEKLSQVYYKKSKFKIEMKKCLWSYKIEDFEERWKALMMENGLEENKWLQQRYDIRASWVPTYNRETFYAGMNTTGRSEGINAFFNDFVTSTTNLREFVVKYEQALKKIVKRESDEDYQTEHKYRIVKDDEFLLKHAAKSYTRNMFEKFKKEWKQVNFYKVEKGECNNEIQTYLVKKKVGEPENEEFVVQLNLNTYEGTCECKKFEFIGILCMHILKVFVRLDIDMIPAHFILERWKQEANKFRIMDSMVPLKNDGNDESDALRLSHMCQEATKLACYASPSVEAYSMFIEALNELSEKLKLVIKPVIASGVVMSIEDVPEPSINVSEIKGDQFAKSSSQLLILDPNISQTKGRKKDVKEKESLLGSDRIKSSMELAQKKKRKCKICHTSGHNKRKCPSNPENK